MTQSVTLSYKERKLLQFCVSKWWHYVRHNRKRYVVLYDTISHFVIHREKTFIVSYVETIALRKTQSHKRSSFVWHNQCHFVIQKEETFSVLMSERTRYVRHNRTRYVVLYDTTSGTLSYEERTLSWLRMSERWRYVRHKPHVDDTCSHSLSYKERNFLLRNFILMTLIPYK